MASRHLVRQLEEQAQTGCTSVTRFQCRGKYRLGMTSMLRRYCSNCACKITALNSRVSSIPEPISISREAGNAGLCVRCGHQVTQPRYSCNNSDDGERRG